MQGAHLPLFRARRLGRALVKALLSFPLLFLSLHPATGHGAETLASLTRAVFSQHPALRSQQWLQDAAAEGVESARRQFWPTPSLSVQRAHSSNDDPSFGGDERVVTLGLQQPLWTGGRLTGNLNQAEARSVVAAAEIEITRQELALRLLQAWSDVLASRASVDAQRQSEITHRRLLGMVERRHNEGLSAKADVELARSRLETASAELSGAQARLDSALERLGVLVGRPVAPASLVAEEVDDYSMVARGQLLEAARETSPQLVKARAQARVAEAEIAIARATLWPELNLRAERQYGSFSIADADPQNRIFIELNTAFGGGLSNLSALKGARAQYQAALEEVQSQQLSVDEQVLADLALANTLRQRKASLMRARDSAGGVSASWERQFLAGRKQWQDLMNAAREQAQADTLLADVLGAEQLTNLRLKVLSEGAGVLTNPSSAEADD